MAVVVGTDVYISVEDATTYCTALGKTAWTGDSSVKEVALRQATQYLDTYFKWAGRLADDAQSLGWPRICAYDAEGRTLSDIPIRVGQACAELAVLALSGPLAPMEVPNQFGRIKRERIGTVDTEYADPLQSGERPIYDLVVSMLRGIGSFKSNGGAVKVIRT